jgi:serine/threonine protein kinase
MLSRFSENTHKHLISVLAAYTHRNFFHLIFPWAEADLLEFWKKKEPEPAFADTVLWVAKQSTGLADGLCKIHRYELKLPPEQPETSTSSAETNSPSTATPAIEIRVSSPRDSASGGSSGRTLYGRHGDIKPSNVLWFDGTLKLTDFGVAEFHGTLSRSGLPKAGLRVSLDYRPPEVVVDGGSISRSYDIWSMGCLYLELIAWLLGGDSLVEKFKVKRTPKRWAKDDHRSAPFFEVQDGGKMARVKKSVKEVRRPIDPTLFNS